MALWHWVNQCTETTGEDFLDLFLSWLVFCLQESPWSVNDLTFLPQLNTKHPPVNDEAANKENTLPS